VVTVDLRVSLKEMPIELKNFLDQAARSNKPYIVSGTKSAQDVWFVKSLLRVEEEDRQYFAELIGNVADSVGVTRIFIENEDYQKSRH
jgi:hypothetical protein